jgi:hypothetical protein
MATARSLRIRVNDVSGATACAGHPRGRRAVPRHQAGVPRGQRGAGGPRGQRGTAEQHRVRAELRRERRVLRPLSPPVPDPSRRGPYRGGGSGRRARGFRPAQLRADPPAGVTGLITSWRTPFLAQPARSRPRLPPAARSCSGLMSGPRPRLFQRGPGRACGTPQSRLLRRMRSQDLSISHFPPITTARSVPPIHTIAHSWRGRCVLALSTWASEAPAPSATATRTPDSRRSQVTP